MNERQKGGEINNQQVLQGIVDLFKAGASLKELKKAIEALPLDLQEPAWTAVSIAALVGPVIRTGRPVIMDKGGIEIH